MNKKARKKLTRRVMPLLDELTFALSARYPVKDEHCTSCGHPMVTVETKHHAWWGGTQDTHGCSCGCHGTWFDLTFMGRENYNKFSILTLDFKVPTLKGDKRYKKTVRELTRLSRQF